MNPNYRKKVKITDGRLGTYLTLSFGAGVLGSQSSDAAIIYKDVITPYTVTTGQSGNFQPMTGAYGTGALSVSPTITLQFSGPNYIYSVNSFLAIGADPATSRLASNATIGAGLTWKGNYSYMDMPGWGSSGTGPWNTGLDGTSGFVGFRFENAGTFNYGWVAVTYNDASQTLVLGDFAYENSGGSILAGATGAAPVPEASSLALLALGATGVIARRRRPSRVIE
jgi:PEP-CTERM motif